MSQCLLDLGEPRGAPVAALYVDSEGPYAFMSDVDPWAAWRDAKRYAGPFPIVAHPPCGPWGRLKYLCTQQDAECGPAAVDQVRQWGGVLEHPSNSTLFGYCSLPKPGDGPDEFGGLTYAVSQVHWGHSCEKPSWLYVVRARAGLVEAGLRSGGTPRLRVFNGPRGPQLPRANAEQIRRTPPAFASWLVEIARSCREATPR